ncbi:hypothetical protein [Halobacterium wangiae]|uniref:hypothetical protein n=1 Tax=Halobacterium wangiae TaxID=2902623 RepID=UPI001E5942AD|nr:hypothetical protein [Halobacterium wangiae]
MTNDQLAPHELSEQLNNAEKIFVMLVDAEGGRSIPGKLWLQKEMFLIAKNLKPLEYYLSYEPHLQGPYSEEVDNLLENLDYRGIICRRGRDITLTETGESIADFLRSSADDELIALIQDVKNLANDLTKDELLVYVYYTYPEMTEASLEKPNLEENREVLARSLYQKGKVTAEKAAELADRDTENFVQAIRV